MIKEFFMGGLKVVGLFLGIIGSIKFIGVISRNKNIIDSSSKIISGKLYPLLKRDKNTILMLDEELAKEKHTIRENTFDAVKLIFTAFCFQIFPTVVEFVESLLKTEIPQLFFQIILLLLLMVNLRMINWIEKKKDEINAEKVDYGEIRGKNPYK